MIRAGLAALCLAATPCLASAQQIIIETTPLEGEREEFSTEGEETSTAAKGEQAAGVLLRALDKVSGETADFELSNGQAAQVFGLQVGVTECRYPAGNPAGDAYAYLVIRDSGEGPAQFAGWMIASSPALNALDHARYDVWVLRCITS